MITYLETWCKRGNKTNNYSIQIVLGAEAEKIAGEIRGILKS